MLDQVFLALADLWGQKKLVIFMVVETVLILFFFQMTRTQYLSADHRESILNSYEQQQTSYFSSQSNFRDNPMKTLDFGRYVQPLLENSQAYLAIPVSVNLSSGESTTAYIYIGDLELIGGERNAHDGKSAVYAGEKFQLGESLVAGDFHQETLQTTMRLPVKGGFLAGGQVISYRDALVIPMTFEQFRYHYWPLDYQKHLVWMNAELEPLSSFLKASDEAGVSLVPELVSSRLQSSNKIIANSGLYGTLLFSLGLLFLSISLLFQLLLLLDSKRREYGIHLAFGASRTHLGLRLGIYVFLLVSLPLLIFQFILVRDDPSMQIQPVVLFLGPFVLTSALTGFSLLRLRPERIIDNIKGDRLWDS